MENARATFAQGVTKKAQCVFSFFFGFFPPFNTLHYSFLTMSTVAIAVSLFSLSFRFTSVAGLSPLKSQLLEANGNKIVLVNGKTTCQCQASAKQV
jgi:hypothetical protein